MYVICTITSWEDSRDSSNRIAPADKGSREILLNTSPMSEIKASGSLPLTSSTFKYFDNDLDRREKWSSVKATETVASLITASDTAFASNMITLPIYKNNNPNNTTTDHTIPVEALSWADDYNQKVGNYCWVVFYNGAFKRREVLCALSLEQLEDIAETGTTSTTTTTSTTP